MKQSDLEWIRDNRIDIIEFFSVGAETKNPSTLFDVKGERRYVRFINSEGVARVFAMDRSFRECVMVNFFTGEPGNYVELTEKGLDVVWANR